MTSPPKILIAGIGNIFLGDDGFGCEVIKQLLQSPAQFPPNVTIKDFGIRGMDLTYALLEPYDIAILIDAVPKGDTPGTLYLIEPDPADVSANQTPDSPLIDMHAMHPDKVLNLVKTMGGQIRRILVIGCEPTPLNPEDMAMELSMPVRAAIPEAVAMVRSLLERIVAGEISATSSRDLSTI